MSLLLLCSWLVNTGHYVYNSSLKFASGVYRLAFTNATWYIMENGVFVNSADFSLAWSEHIWVYKDNIIYYFGNGDNYKKPPLLSCLFTYDDKSISMDDFLEEVRCPPHIPLPVLMAAFTIHQQKLYPWLTSNFEAILRNGNQVNFAGSVIKLPSE